MRKRRGVLLTALLGVLVFSTVGVASASAKTECEYVTKTGSKKYALCVAGNPTTAAEASTVLKSGTNVVAQFPGDYGLDVVCTGLGGSGEFTRKAPASVTLSFGKSGELFTGCKVTSTGEGKAIERKCKTPSSTTFLPAVGSFGPGVEGLSSSTGETWAAFWLEDNGVETCPNGFLGEHEAKGNYECKLHEATVEEIEHELSCEVKLSLLSGSGQGEVKFSYTQLLALGGSAKGKKFSIYESTT
jgi:hypothetical protein